VRTRGDGAVRQAEAGVRAGFYSPLPPARTGVSDYSAALLSELRSRGGVDIVTGSSTAPCDIALYHLGNNALHAGIYLRALAEPGVAVLHDAVLHHFFLGQLDETQYIEEFTYNYGKWHRGLAGELWRARGSSASDPRYFEYPMLRRAAEISRAVIVHNPAAAETVKRHAPEAKVVEIPHLFQPPPAVSGADAMRYRQRMGIEPGAFLFGVFGYLRESKRVAQTVEAFLDLRRELPRAALLVAGDFASSDLDRAMAPLMKSPGIVRLPYLAEREFWLAATAVDACINLKYPGAGETSGIAIRLMGIGKALLITDAPECARYPEGACIRIPPGSAERRSLLEHMRMLASMPGVADAIGRRAAAHIAEQHRIDQVAKQYWETLFWAAGAAQAISRPREASHRR
jgi:glycosyltransferase involved in cell wall biosynthesis